MLGPGDFFGEGCLAGQPVRIGSATAISATSVRGCQEADGRTCCTGSTPGRSFTAHMLSRNVRIEAGSHRPAVQLQRETSGADPAAPRALRAAGQATADRLPKISQETLSEMVGTTRSRVNFFMNKFKRLGFIEYDGDLEAGIEINSSLLSVVLRDRGASRGDGDPPTRAIGGGRARRFSAP